MRGAGRLIRASGASNSGKVITHGNVAFTINLIAALIVVVVYLERYSFDNQQRESHLIAFQERCEALNEALETVPQMKEQLARINLQS
jgi:hypothetical protein